MYIGQTTLSAEERFKAHLKPSTNKKMGSYKIYNAMNKYGRDTFYYEVLEENIPIEELDDKEIEYIAKYNSYFDGYNSTPGGDGRIINKINHEEEVLALANQGVGAEEIANKFKVHKATILRTLHKLGFFYRCTKKEDEILQLYKQGLSNIDISEKIRCHPDTISRCLFKNSIRKHMPALNKREDFDYEGLFNDYKNQMPINELCEKYNISESVFYRTKKKFNIPTRKQVYVKRSSITNLQDKRDNKEHNLICETIGG